MKKNHKSILTKRVLCVLPSKDVKDLPILLESCNFSFQLVYSLDELLNNEFLKDNCIILVDTRNKKSIPDSFNMLISNFPIVFVTKKEVELSSIVFNEDVDVLFENELNPQRIKLSIARAFNKYASFVQRDILKQQQFLIGQVSYDIIWDWDLKTDIIQYSPESWKKVFGFNNENKALNFEAWVSFVHPDDRDFMRKYYHDVLTDTKADSFFVEYRMRSATGFIYVMEKGSIIRNDEKSAVKLVGVTRNIDDIKTIEQERDRLAAIAREVVNSVVMTNPEGFIQWANNAFKIKTGYSKEDLYHLTIEQILYAEDEIGAQELRRKLNSKQPFSVEVESKFNEGKYYWVEASFQAQYDNRANHIGYFMVMADITLRKDAEEKLRSNEKRFRALVENIRDGITVVSPEKMIMELYSGQNILGFSLEELNNGASVTNLHPNFKDQVVEAFAKVVSTPFEKVQIAYQIKRKNGEYIWLDSTMYNLTQEKSVKGILINFRDITDEKNAEELLKQSEKKYRDLFYNNPLAIIIWDPATFKVLEVNMATVIQYGYDVDTLAKMSFKDLVHPESQKSLVTIAKNSQNNALSYTTYQTRHVDKDGNIMYMEVAFHPIDYYERKVSMAIIKNISEQVELEKRLEQERVLKQQEVTNAAITAQEQERLHIGLELHDNINQILATIRLYIEYALANQEKSIPLLESAKDLLYSAVNEVRNISKSLLPPSVGEKGLVASLDDLFDSFKKLNLYSIRTNWEMNENKLSEKLKLTIFRIIQEQMNNVFKHAMAKNIFVELIGKDSKLTLLVEDDGIGFNTNESSSGVGLRNIRSRAELQGGTVQIQSVIGKGTRLVVTFLLNE